MSTAALVTTAAPHGRVAQRRRTRTAIVDAAAVLLAEGHDPSVAEIAAAAQVSRRTVYLHFPTLEQLLIDATLGAMAAGGKGAGYDADSYGTDVRDRITGLVDTLLAMSRDALPLGRRLIRLTVEAPAQDRSSPRRGYRRVQWIEQALEPLRDRLSSEQHARLVSALAVLLGWEAMVVLRDLRSVGPRTEKRVTTWAALAVVDAMLAEAGGPRRAGGRVV